MLLSSHFPSVLLLVLPSLTLAQGQGVLTDGNSQFPSCAASCPILGQAAAACGGTASASQGAWICFCQSGYLSTLYSSATGICDSVCTNPSDNDQVRTWYTTNCGTDHGASEHANDDAAATTTIVASSTSSEATLGPSSANVATSVPSNTAASGAVTGSDDNNNSYTGSWWSAHYKWVIMVIVLFFALLAIALGAVFLRRRHDRRRDQIRGGFNAGITERTAPMGEAKIDSPPTSTRDSTMAFTGMGPSGSGRNSPARTRDAFMPYGYGYSRSESRLQSPGGISALAAVEPNVRTGSPLARSGMSTVELEKEVGLSGRKGAGGRRVLVREKSAADHGGKKAYEI